MLVILGQILLGFAFLIFSGDLLVKGAVRLAQLFKVSVLVIGLTVVAIGTSAPEVFTSLSATLQGSSALALGNVVGSNIANILLVLGAASLIFPIAIHKKIASRDACFMLFLTLVLVIFAYQNYLNFISGGIFLFLFILYLIKVVRQSRAEHDEVLEKMIDEEEIKKSTDISTKKAVIFCVLAIIGLAFGGKILITGAISFADYFGISQSFVGVSLVAFGTSAPELVTSIIAAIKKEADLALGNVVGSNIFNIALVMSICGFVSDLEVERSFLTFHLPYLLAVSLALYLMVKFGQKIGKFLGVLFLAFYVTYIGIQV